jgi:protease-4
VIELFGAITDGGDTVRQIRDFARRDDLRGIVIRIDSPGGAVAPSQEIYEALKFAAKSKPVVASMGSVAASGGFWSALGADWIFASPGSITGSIGVLSQTPDLRGLADLLRVKMRTFTSGPLKDAGNPFREMTPEDEELFMSLINDIYMQFVSVVAERRKLDLETVKNLADGRVMTGRAALEAGLVDELGGLHDAARKVVLLAEAREAEEEPPAETSTAAEGEIEDPTLIYPKKPIPGLLRMLIESTESAVSKGIAAGIGRAAGGAADAAGEAAGGRGLLRDAAPVELR